MFLATVTDYLGIGGLEFYYADDLSRYLIMGIDPSLGIGHDATGIEAISLKDAAQVLEYRTNALSPKAVIETILPKIFADQTFKIVQVVIESNAIGHEWISRYLELPEKLGNKIEIPSLYSTTKKNGEISYGFDSYGATKQILISEMRELVKNHPELFRSHRLLNELLAFQILGGGKIGAKTSAARSDDLVMAYALALRGRQQYFLNPDPNIMKELSFSVVVQESTPMIPFRSSRVVSYVDEIPKEIRKDVIRAMSRNMSLVDAVEVLEELLSSEADTEF